MYVSKSYYVCSPSGNKGPFSLDTLETLHRCGSLPGTAKIIKENGDVYPLDYLLEERPTGDPVELKAEPAAPSKFPWLRWRFDRREQRRRAPIRRARASKGAVPVAKKVVKKTPLEHKDFLVVINEDASEYNIMGLSGEILFASTLGGAKLEDAGARLTEGEAPDAVFDRKATLVYIKDICAVDVSVEKSILSITCRVNKNKEEVLFSLQFPGIKELKEMLEQLRVRLGDRLKMAEAPVGFFSACGRSLFFVVGGPIFTFLFYMAALEVISGADVEVSGRHAAKKALFIAMVQMVGPSGVVVIGVLFTLCALIWMARRLKNRPTLKRSVVST